MGDISCIEYFCEMNAGTCKLIEYKNAVEANIFQNFKKRLKYTLSNVSINLVIMKLLITMLMAIILFI